MSYTFVTREEFDSIIDGNKLNPSVVAIKLAFLADRLLAERDAYREVARKTGHVCHVPGCKCGEDVDSEAARAMEGK